MNVTPEGKCLLWLSAAEVTPAKVDALTETYGSAAAVWEAFGKPDGPRFPAQAQDRLSRLHSQTAMDALLRRLDEKHVQLLFRTDAAYPPQLLAIDDPPYVLYYAGDAGCLSRPMVAVVGTRRSSQYGRSMAKSLASGLARAGVCVVSGLARGIDEAAHEGALEEGGATLGVLGSGINVPYPPEHTMLLRRIAGGNGLVLSEYPLDAEPVPFHFPHRNRLISGLCLGVVLVEGRLKSGGMLTVGAALNQGREVFAVPGRVGCQGSEGPHTLLREGARMATCAQDVLEDLGLVPLQAPKPPTEDETLTSTQRSIIHALKVEPMNVEELQKQTGIDASALLSELGMLEIAGLIEREAGNRFVLPIGK